MSRRHPSVSLLAAASGASPFGMAIILPALPRIVERFDSDYSQVQLVVSSYLLGVAIAQPVSGFLCDRFGRRRVLLTGFGIFIVASVGCALANSLPALIACRMLQATGASTGTVVSRAVIRDVFSAAQGTQALSVITIGLGIAPVIAPMIGGWLVREDGIDNVFWFVAAVGTLLLVSIAVGLPETQSGDLPSPRWREGIGNYGRLLKSRLFVGYTLVFGFVQGSFFAFLAVGAAVFQDSFGLGPATFGVVWGAMAIAYVVGAVVGGRLSASSVSASVVPAGVGLTLIVGLLMLAGILAFGVTTLSVLLPIGVLMALSGAVTPLVMAGAVQHHPDIAGTSAGLSSALSLVIGNAFVVLSGVLYAGEYLPIAVLMTISTSLTAASWLIIRRGESDVR